jgi:tRNA pseudouridine38-40 synthase
MGRRLWAKVEYDGSDFWGFQIQARGRTVQGEIERAIGVVAGQPTRVSGAGRTDRGVHAQGQVIAFEVEWKHDLYDLQRALNAVLATDVAILELGPAAEGFHPRFSALSRTYRYTVLNLTWRQPLARRIAWHVKHWLDVERMAQASRCLVGSHDFATFGRPLSSENTVRTVFQANWQELRPWLTFDIEANAFLNRMVRSMVGGLVLVGRGQMTVEEFVGLLQARDRSQVRLVAPACGLCLVRVDYAGREGVVQ